MYQCIELQWKRESAVQRRNYWIPIHSIEKNLALIKVHRSSNNSFQNAVDENRI